MGALKKILATSLGAALMTEEGARRYIARQMDQRKQELTRIIHEEIRKALQGLTIEIKIKGAKRLSK